MDTVVAFEIGGGELPEQVVQFVNDLNWLRDEGYVDFEEVDGVVRVFPALGSNKWAEETE